MKVKFIVFLSNGVKRAKCEHLQVISKVKKDNGYEWQECGITSCCDSRSKNMQVNMPILIIIPLLVPQNPMKIECGVTFMNQSLNIKK
ncbi:hypothetical protein AAY42_13580 [Flagellimonas eckloniae]|uniref:Uncharacterized protein n=1 Tax=Flagellimonas eckloniae TaxID=346185 RepID=A0A0Q0XIL6_9FLAO|nr:hypothetical protein AAY42_13580 [Allomuricauda eckloniae]